MTLGDAALSEVSQTQRDTRGERTLTGGPRESGPRGQKADAEPGAGVGAGARGRPGLSGFRSGKMGKR